MIRGILPWERPAKHGIYRLGFCLARSQAADLRLATVVSCAKPLQSSHPHTHPLMESRPLSPRSVHYLFLKSLCTAPHDTIYQEAHISGSDTRTNPTFGISRPFLCCPDPPNTIHSWLCWTNLVNSWTATALCRPLRPLKAL